MRASPKHDLGVGPPAGCMQRALLVLWLLRREVILIRARALTIFADFEVLVERVAFELYT